MNYALFRRPSRYIGNEINIIKKKADTKVALCFPDVYEIGMSHLGFRILYEVINSIPDACAERVYAPWIDLEAYLRAGRHPLASLETHRPLREFDIIGFTLQYELSFTNILNMLDLGMIPLRSEDRDVYDPLVIAGGPCAVNPLPLLPFIDAFVIGDGEEVIGEIIECFRAWRSDGPVKDRTGLLQAISSIEGVYVPLIHGTETRIRRRIIKDLDRAPYPERPIVPYTGIIHDRITIEIARGCGRGCRFCQAGFIYRPVRERSMHTILRIARASIINTGYEEVSFTSLSSGDYSALPELIKNFNTICSQMMVAVSLPSLRVGSLSSEILREIKAVRKTGFTIAPEAGSERLRGVINKDYSDEEYEQTLKILFSEGWRHIKLYFMIGLPTETTEDIESMINMVKFASEVGEKITGRRVNINVGVSAFVPKPHTPFQWMGQVNIDELREKKDYVVRSFKKIGANFKGQHVETSLLEAVFSRGDERIADLLETAWKEGCRFDGWSELFDFEKWKRASEITGIDMFEYAQRDFDPDKPLPWEFIDTGVETSFLRTELSRAYKGKRTPDCMRACPDCGLDCNKEKFSREKIPAEGQRKEPIVIRDRGKPVTRLRVMYSKTGLMRFLSHHELMVCIIRAVRRAGIPVAYSSGFHPHPKISFGPALSVGVEGHREFFDINLRAEIKEEEFIHTMNRHLPEGLRVLDAVKISKREPALSQVITEYEYELSIEGKDIISRVQRFLDSEQSLKALIVRAGVKENILYLYLRDTENMKVRIQEILAEMGIAFESVMVRRTGLYGYNKRDIMNGLLELR